MRQAVILTAAFLAAGLAAPAAAQASTAAAAVTPAGIKAPYVWYYNFHSGKCISVPDSSTANGKQLWQYSCMNKKNFGWVPVTGFKGEEYFIRNENTDRCMAVSKDSIHSGAAIVQEPCNYKNPPQNQRFEFHQIIVSNGYQWDIAQAVYSGLCLNVKSNSKKNEAKLVQYSCVNQRGQNEWFIFVKEGVHLPCPCTNAQADRIAAKPIG
jgi:ricin-type beta-trefoil lectin protein